MIAEPLLAGGIEDRRDAKVLVDALCGVGVRAAASQADALRVWFGENLYEFTGAAGEYVLADPCVDNTKVLSADVDLLVSALERIQARCRFEIYEDAKLVSYHHFRWPQAAAEHPK
jgi:hypothetical protein